MLTPSFDHFPSKRGTWFIAYRPNATVDEKRLMGSFSGGTAPMWVVYNNNEFPDRYLYANTFGTSPSRLQGDLAGEVVVRAIRRTSDTQWDWFRGPTKQWTATLADVTLATNQLRIGQQFEGRIGEILFYPSALSDSNVEKVAEYLTRKWAKGRPLNLAFAGDSQTQGANIVATADQDTYPAKVYGTVGDGRSALWNEGVGGSRWVELTSRASALDDRITPYAQNVLFVWCGTNEVGTNNAPASAAAAETYLAARRAAGWETIVVLTAMDRVEGQNEPWRTAYNTALRGLCTSNGYILADIAADSRIGAAGAFANSSYFQVDGIHLNAGGTTVAAEVVLAAVLPYLAD
jgi:lysophospholipase L1-like esterase